MMASKTRALVSGHSFVRRVVEFTNLHHDSYRRDLNLSEVCGVEIFGVGGRTVDKMIRLDLEVIKRNASNAVVFEIGTNDICDSHCSADTVALSIVAFTELLIKSLSVPFVVVCQILPRMHTPFEGYNERVQKVKTLLLEALQNINSPKFWRHGGLVNPAKNVYARDGIHSNDFGNEALNRSYRGAIIPMSLNGQSRQPASNSLW